MTKILYVEDELALASIVKDTLEMHEFEVVHFEDGLRAKDFIESDQVHICILDVMLPNLDGFSLGIIIRTNFPKMPIIYLTAKNQTADVLEGFSSGGNDYLKKPFSIEELIVRIKNLISLAIDQSSISDELIRIASFNYYPDRLVLEHPKAIQKLTHRENELLKYFALRQNSVIDRAKLLNAVWGDDSYYNSRSLDVFVKKIRIKE